MADQIIAPNPSSPFNYTKYGKDLVEEGISTFSPVLPNVAYSNIQDIRLNPDKKTYLAAGFVRKAYFTSGLPPKFVYEFSGTEVNLSKDTYDSYFKPNGNLPEYEYEGGEFSEIVYSFDRVRLVPNNDAKGSRLRIRVGDRVINGSWNLVADLHVKLVRYLQVPILIDPIITQEDAEDVYRPFKEEISGVVSTNVVLATSKLIYRTRNCTESLGKPDGVDFDWYFEIDEIETLASMNIKQKSGSRPSNVPILDDFGDEIGREGISISLSDRIRNEVSLDDDTSRIIFSPDGKVEPHKRPITQHIIWSNHRRKTSWLGGTPNQTQSNSTTFFLEPPLGFYMQDKAFEVLTSGDISVGMAGANLPKLYIYYGTSIPQSRGNDTILVARTLKITEESLEENTIDPNWWNFNAPPEGQQNFQMNDKGILDFYGMYKKFIDWEWIPEWGNPSFSYQAEKFWKSDGTGPYYRTSRVIPGTKLPDVYRDGEIYSPAYNPGETEWIKPLSSLQVEKGRMLWYGGKWDFNKLGTPPPGTNIGQFEQYRSPWIMITGLNPRDGLRGRTQWWINPYTVTPQNTGYPPGYSGTKNLREGTQLDKDGNILRPIPQGMMGNLANVQFLSDKSLIGGSVGCPPVNIDRYDIWKISETGIILNQQFRFGEAGFLNDEYASRRAYIEIQNLRIRNLLSGDLERRYTSLNPAFIIPRGTYSDDRRYYMPYGPNPDYATYFFRDIRFVPTYDITRNSSGKIIGYDRKFRTIGDKIIPGAWNLIADLYMYLPTYRNPTVGGSSGLIRQYVGILYPDYVLASGDLVSNVNIDCEDIFGYTSVSYRYRFPAAQIESLSPLSIDGYANHANNIRAALSGINRGKNYKIGLPGLKPGDPAVVNRLEPFVDSFVNGETGRPPRVQLTLLDVILKQNAFEKSGNKDWQPYRQENERYWSYSYGNLPKLVDNEPKGVFGILDVSEVSIDKKTIIKYVVASDVPFFTNKVNGVTPCVSGSWDFREEYPEKPYSDEALLQFPSCEDAIWQTYSINPLMEFKEYVDPSLQPFGATDRTVLGYVPKITKIKNEELSETFLSRDPSSPCYSGYKTVYDITEYLQVSHSKQCWVDVDESQAFEPNVLFDGEKYRQFNTFFSGSVEFVNKTESIWEQPERVFCDCIDVKVPSPSVKDPDDPCGCKEIYFDTVYRVCVDDGLYYYENKIVPPNKLPDRVETRYKVSVDCNKVAVKVNHKINPETDIIYAKNILEQKPILNGSDTITCYYTSSMQRSSSYSYYYDVVGCENCGYEPYFGVSYGNIKGSGSLYKEYEEDDSPSKSVYSQYRLISLEEPQKRFNFYTNGVLDSTNEDIYVMNFYRNYFKDGIDPGNFQLSLAELNGNSVANNVHTSSNVQVSSSNKVITLIDNSFDLYNQQYCSDSPYYSFDLISGSLVNGAYDLQTTHSYGTVYPELNIVVLDAKKLNNELGFNTVTGSNINGDNSYKLFTSISGAAALNHPIKIREIEEKTVTEYFLRIPFAEANYSNNPTYVVNNGLSSTRGTLKNKCFVNNPVTYVTAIGLYNNNNELVAIAKPSRPIKKTADDELYLKVRLSI
jgi:hypothetical protein